MKNKVFLIAGTEWRYRKMILRMKKMLKHCDCAVHVVRPSILLFLFWSLLWTKKDQSFLLVYNGHGSPKGWEGRVLYSSIIFLLRFFSGKLLVINDTCYGLNMLRHLKKVRQEHNTGFIGAWDSDGLSYGGPVADALSYWPKRLTVEDEVDGIIYSTMEKDVEYPVQQRWGIKLDHMFFPQSKIS